MDSLSYWFLSLWISSFFKLSAYTASSCSLLIYFIECVPMIWVFLFEADTPDLWYWDDRILYVFRLRQDWSLCTLYRIFSSILQFSYFFVEPIWSNSHSHLQNGYFGQEVIQSSPTNRQSFHSCVSGNEVPSWRPWVQPRLVALSVASTNSKSGEVGCA